MTSGYFRQFLLAIFMLLCSAATGELNLSEYAEAYPDRLDPFTGNWTGQWVGTDQDDPEISAQVYGLGEGRYRVTFKYRV